MMAVRSGHRDTVELLLRRGASTDLQNNVRLLRAPWLTCVQAGWSALHIAAAVGNCALAKALLAQRCDLSLLDQVAVLQPRR